MFGIILPNEWGTIPPKKNVRDRTVHEGFEGFPILYYIKGGEQGFQI